MVRDFLAKAKQGNIMHSVQAFLEKYLNADRKIQKFSNKFFDFLEGWIIPVGTLLLGVISSGQVRNLVNAYHNISAGQNRPLGFPLNRYILPLSPLTLFHR
jgi:uncharacterized protein YijF (DUF1287 family)